MNSVSKIVLGLLILIIGVTSYILLKDSNLTEEQQLAIPPENDEWEESWETRLVALRKFFGKEEDEILTAFPPIYNGGNADVLMFAKNVSGINYITAGLTGLDQQKKSEHGQYELMMSFEVENDWAPNLLSQLAPYTHTTVLSPMDTMDIAPSMPEGSTIAGLLFVKYEELEIPNQKAFLLLAIGITADELEYCKKHDASEIVMKLKNKNVFPFTKPFRESVL